MTASRAVLAIQDSPFARKLAAFVRLSDADLSAMSDLYRRRRRFAVGVDMIHQGESDQNAYVLASGWACPTRFCPAGRGRSSISRSPAISSGCGRCCSALRTTMSNPLRSCMPPR
jgi:hypothetical protein